MPWCDPPVVAVPYFIRSSASVCIYGCIHSYYSFFLLFKDKNNEIMAMVKSDLIHKRLNGKALREYKQTITLSQIQREMLVGTLLGDASIPFRKGKSTLSVKFTQTLSRAEYIQQTFLKTRSGDFVGAPPRVQKICDMRGGQARRLSIYTVSNFLSPLVYLI